MYPLKYNLLFERFLNPDRVSLPDIDIDFDDEGRSSVMDYVIKKYGSKQVAQIMAGIFTRLGIDFHTYVTKINSEGVMIQS